MEDPVLEEMKSNHNSKLNRNKKTPQSLKCMYSNLQSIINKKKEIELYLDQNETHLMFFTEVWLDSTHHASELHIKGFQDPIIQHNSRGAACIYVYNDIIFEEVLVPHKLNDSVWLKTSTKDGISRLFGCVYRSLNSQNDNNSILLENLNWARENFPEVIMVGDFNLPQIEWDTNEATEAFSKQFIECLEDNSMEQLVRENTRFRIGQNPSLLDLLIVSDPNVIEDIAYSHPFGKSDHCVLSFEVKNIRKLEKRNKYKLNYKKMDHRKFQNIIQEVDHPQKTKTLITHMKNLFE